MVAGARAAAPGRVIGRGGLWRLAALALLAALGSCSTGPEAAEIAGVWDVTGSYSGAGAPCTLSGAMTLHADGTGTFVRQDQCTGTSSSFTIPPHEETLVATLDGQVIGFRPDTPESAYRICPPLRFEGIVSADSMAGTLSSLDTHCQQSGPYLPLAGTWHASR